MTTRDFARTLNIIEHLYLSGDSQKPVNQKFDYLFVLDFEATCWEKTDPQKSPPEIIEFPVVLYDIKKGEILEEFQKYVIPTEHPTLSKFCTELTGIEQILVDEGVSLPICLRLFNEWVEKVKIKYNLSFHYESSFSSNYKAAFVTWSDWDLGTCLRKECRRKNLLKPRFFDKRIDLRKLYVNHYNRQPKGLHGALTEVGLVFEGREHCGLHDARNTAKLAGKMISDGILLEFTRNK